MERIDDLKPSYLPVVAVPYFDPSSILPACLPMKTPDSLQKFAI